MSALLQSTANLLLFGIGLAFAAAIFPNPYKDLILVSCGIAFSLICIAAWIRAFWVGSRVAQVTVILTTLMLLLSIGFSLLTFNMGFGYSLAVGGGCLCYQLNLAFNPKGFGMKQFAVVALWSCLFAAALAGLFRLVLTPAIEEKRIVSHRMHYTVEDFSTAELQDHKPTPPAGLKKIRFWMDSAPDQAVIIVSSDLVSHLRTLPGPTVRVDVRVKYMFRDVYAYNVLEVEGYDLHQHARYIFSATVEERLYDFIEKPRGFWSDHRNSTVSLLDRRYSHN